MSEFRKTKKIHWTIPKIPSTFYFYHFLDFLLKNFDFFMTSTKKQTTKQTNKKNQNKNKTKKLTNKQNKLNQKQNKT